MNPKFTTTANREITFTNFDAEIEMTFENLRQYSLKQIVCTSIFRCDETGKPRRKTEYFICANGLPLDFDSGEFSMIQVRDVLEHYGYKYIIMPSKNHLKQKDDKPPCERFHVYLFPSRPITTVAAYKATLKKLFEIFNNSTDEHCSDVTRCFYPSQTIAFESPNGKLFEVVEPKTMSGKGILFSETIDFLENGAKSGTWHVRFVNAAFDLREQGYSFDEAVKLMKNATKNYLGYLDNTDMQQIKDVYFNRTGKYNFRPSRDAKTKTEKGSTASSFSPPTPEQLFESYTENLKMRFEANTKAVSFINPRFDKHLKLGSGLVMVGAMSGKGKTTACHNIIANIIETDVDKKILLISNEESVEEVYSKIACLMLKIDWKKEIQPLGNIEASVNLKKQAVDNKVKVLTKTLTVLSSEINNTCTLESVVNILEFSKTQNYSVVIIDYYQAVCMSTEMPNAKEYEVLKKLGLNLKQYAASCKIPVVVLSQLHPDPDDNKAMSERIQGDRTFYNHCHTVLEVIPDTKALTTTIACHKQRWGNNQEWEVELNFDRGRLVPENNNQEESE